MSEVLLWLSLGVAALVVLHSVRTLIKIRNESIEEFMARKVEREKDATTRARGSNGQ